MVGRTGPLTGLRVVELSHERCAFAAKMMADLGAEVVVVEPPGGSVQRTYEPFVDDEPGPERSLWWWHYNTSKLGAVLDLGTAEGADAFRSLCRTADIVVEGEDPGRLAALGVDHDVVRSGQPSLIWVSVTPYGRSGPRNGWQATDLTLVADGGLAWSCGYDDHSLPPVRGGGNQGYQTAGIFAVLSALTAVLVRDAGGPGQFIDVNMCAAVNVTTEAATYEYLVAQATVQRQTCRHANPEPTTESHVRCADGAYATTGFPPTQARQFQAVIDWLDELGCRDELPEAFFLEMGVQRGSIHLSEITEDPEAREIFGTGRNAMRLIAAKLPAHEFFRQGQEKGMAVGAILSPEEVVADPHFVERGFPVQIHHDDLGRDVTYPGLPFRCSAAPGGVGRAPRLGEHQDHLFQLGTDPS